MTEKRYIIHSGHASAETTDLTIARAILTTLPQGWIEVDPPSEEDALLYSNKQRGNYNTGPHGPHDAEPFCGGSHKKRVRF